VNAIETHGLTRYYGDLCAVNRLDLSVRRGELLAFLGPNGAGKTTTIRMLTGLIRPSEGTAIVDGHDVARDPLAVKARVGVVPQRSNLYGELTVRDNLVFMAKLYGLPRRRWRPRADELLEQFGLADRADSRFAVLSGGLKRRLTIAAALVHEPPILFLDEPTTGLDVQSARHIRGLIGELRDSGVTVFLTTHYLPEAENLADRVAIIVQGQLVAVDRPAALCAAANSQRALEVVVPGVNDALMDDLGASSTVEQLSRSGDVLRLRLNGSLEAALADLAAIVLRHGAEIESVRSVVPTLEDAFVVLTHLDVEALQNNLGGRQRGASA